MHSSLNNQRGTKYKHAACAAGAYNGALDADWHCCLLKRCASAKDPFFCCLCGVAMHVHRRFCTASTTHILNEQEGMWPPVVLHSFVTQLGLVAFRCLCIICFPRTQFGQHVNIYVILNTQFQTSYQAASLNTTGASRTIYKHRRPKCYLR